MAESVLNPVGQYEPELLLLAPESGEDAYVLSLVAQLLELGVAFELDADWRLPKSPPRDLSAYKACLFPESAEAKHGRDLDAFGRAGGFVPRTRFYPEAPEGIGDAMSFCGRDMWFWHVAQGVLEGGLRTNHPGFAATLAARPAEGIAADMRDSYFQQYGAEREVPWRAWGDPTYTQAISNLMLAEAAQDGEWRTLARNCLERMAASAPALAEQGRRCPPGRSGITHDRAMAGGMLMRFGHLWGEASMKEAGAALARAWLDGVPVRDGVLRPRVPGYQWNETCNALAALFWLTRTTGDEEPARLGMAFYEHLVGRNHRPDGLWHHWSADDGSRGAAWSRGQMWGILGATDSLQALPPDDARADFLAKTVSRTLDGLAAYQDRAAGVWHLVVDEPETRIEATSAAGFIYCHDRLRELGRLDNRHAEMAQRAFEGLKRLHYAGGLGACCRGTGSGTPNYYRTRPMGYFDRGLFGACVAKRLAPASQQDRYSPVEGRNQNDESGYQGNSC